MVKHLVSGILFSALIIVVPMVGTTIVKNGSKVSAPSMTSIKEDIGYGLRDVVHELIDSVAQTSVLQREVLDQSEALLTQDGESFFANATRQELLQYKAECQKALDVIQEQHKQLKNISKKLKPAQ